MRVFTRGFLRIEYLSELSKPNHVGQGKEWHDWVSPVEDARGEIAAFQVRSVRIHKNMYVLNKIFTNFLKEQSYWLLLRTILIHNLVRVYLLVNKKTNNCGG